MRAYLDATSLWYIRDLHCLFTGYASHYDWYHDYEEKENERLGLYADVPF